ncbi:MAG: hypothetical protein HFJ50_07925 [Clostridia bacterium]|nr:hypothetical protein [Clostridia bacterium]
MINAIFYFTKIVGVLSTPTNIIEPLFIEKALKLIKDDGIIGYITPHKFMINKSGENLRYVLSRGKYI